MCVSGVYLPPKDGVLHDLEAILRLLASALDDHNLTERCGDGRHGGRLTPKHRNAGACIGSVCYLVRRGI